MTRSTYHSQAERWRRLLVRNTERYYDEGMPHAIFTARNGRLWRRIEAAGLQSAVCAALNRWREIGMPAVTR